MPELIEALPAASTSPLALAAYLVVVGVWLAYSYLRLRPVRQASTILKHLDDDQSRIEALRNLTGVAPPTGLKKAEIMEWVRSQSRSRGHNLLLIGYLATLGAFVAVFAIAWTNRNPIDPPSKDVDITGVLLLDGIAAREGTVTVLRVRPRPAPYEVDPGDPGHFEFRDVVVTGKSLTFDVAVPRVEYIGTMTRDFYPPEAVTLEVTLPEPVEVAAVALETDTEQPAAPTPEIRYAVDGRGVPANRIDVPGEKYDCASGRVKCETVEVCVPASSTVLSKTREVASHTDRRWGSEIPWGAWVDGMEVSLSDGLRCYRSTFKLWRKSYGADIRLTVEYTD